MSGAAGGPGRAEASAGPGRRRALRVACATVLGEREAIVRDVRRFDVHGARYADVTVGYADGVLETARLGAESIPGDLEVGESVMVSRAVNMIVGIRRP